jgi:hypothetical protein
LIFAEPLNDTPPIVLAVASTVAVAASPTAMLALPLNEVPPIVLAVVRVAALPLVFWLPALLTPGRLILADYH